MQKNNVNYLFILTILVISISMNSCYKKNFKDHAGPSICPSDNFAYTEQPSLNLASINLNTDTLKIRAEMNEEISWTVSIKGLTSKSFKNFSGYGNEIVVNWLGNPDTSVFFQTEQCEATIRIACLTEEIVKPFTITNVSNFSYFNYLMYNGDAGALGTGPVAYGPAGVATWGAEASLNSPQGGNCFCLNGNSGTTLHWYFGGFDLNVGATAGTTLGSNVSSDPEKVYFNAFVNVKGSQLSIPVVNFKEGSVQRTKYLYIYGTGWQYVSFKLSEANVLNPQDITVVSFGLSAYPTQGTSGDMCVDFVTFTNDAPFFKTE